MSEDEDRRRPGHRGSLERIEASERRRFSDPEPNCGDPEPHPAHEHYGQPAALRQDCPGSE